MDKNASSSTPPAMPERPVSIEEPKTLSEAELAFFREAALKVLNNHSPEEATKIFLGKMETTVAAATKELEPAEKADN